MLHSQITLSNAPEVLPSAKTLNRKMLMSSDNPADLLENKYNL